MLSGVSASGGGCWVCGSRDRRTTTELIWSGKPHTIVVCLNCLWTPKRKKGSR